MKCFYAVALLAFVGMCCADSNNSTQSVTCDPNLWGDDCQNVCGYCSPSGQTADRNCNVRTGECAISCADGYTGMPLCTEPKCDNGCGPGICVAPNYCAACGDINYVSPDCHDIRPGGLIGSLIALIVISCSITVCSVGSKWYNKKQAQRSNLSL